MTNNSLHSVQSLSSQFLLERLAGYLLSFAKFMLGSKSNAVRQSRGKVFQCPIWRAAQFPYKFNAPTGKEMCPIRKPFPNPFNPSSDSDADAELMPGYIKIALSATRIMQAQPGHGIAISIYFMPSGCVLVTGQVFHVGATK